MTPSVMAATDDDVQRLIVKQRHQILELSMRNRLIARRIQEVRDGHADVPRPGISSAALAHLERAQRALAPEVREKQTCAICLDEIDFGQQRIRPLGCHGHAHAFHGRCLVQWLKFSTSCPLCKAHVLGEHQHDENEDDGVGF